MVYSFHPQPLELPLKAKIPRERFEPLHRGGVNARDLDFDLRLRGLPGAHLVHADDAALPNEGYAVAALLDFAEQVRVEKDRRTKTTLFADDIAHQFASCWIEAGSGLLAARPPAL